MSSQKSILAQGLADFNRIFTSALEKVFL